VRAAVAARIPVVARAEMLGELMRFRYSIAVAGTHGKTTTTSLIASILSEGGEDPTYVIGGRLKSAASNARLGAGRYLVAEADESDASFTHLQPLIAIVTNIDNDHLSAHGGDFGLLKQSFVDFLHNLPFYGLAVLCADDEHLRSILQEVSRPILSYGLESGADVRGENLRPAGLQTHFDVRRPGAAATLAVMVNLAGVHNVRNALAAIAVATELDIDDRAILRALAAFQGIDRRLQHIGDVLTAVGRISIVDDYAHHPTEVAVTLAAVRQGYPGRRVLLAFQPHRYTRTRDLIDDFGKALSGADLPVRDRGLRRGRDRDPRRRRPRHLPRGAQPRTARAVVCREGRGARPGAQGRDPRRRRHPRHGRGQHQRRGARAPGCARGTAAAGEGLVTLAVAPAVPGAACAAMSPSAGTPPGTSGDLRRCSSIRATAPSWRRFCAPCPPGYRSSSSGSAATCWCVTGESRGSSSAPTARSMPSRAVNETTVQAEAGVACARIARQCIKWGLGPAEFFAGIPGTLGGALAMNAGAFGGETWRHVLSVETIDRGGHTHSRAAGEYRVSYRRSSRPRPRNGSSARA